MKRPSPEVVKDLAQIVKQYPEFAKWIQEWGSDELSRLPNVAAENVTLAQGRCQVLLELVKLVIESPELAAKSK
jgi:hypothetical protein